MTTGAYPVDQKTHSQRATIGTTCLRTTARFWSVLQPYLWEHSRRVVAAVDAEDRAIRARNGGRWS